MTTDIRLIATDLDGTLIGSANDFPFYNEFRQKINQFRINHNAAWAVCTGRSRRSFNQFFNPMRTMGLMPDYIIVRHAYIFRLTRFGYIPHITWNARIRHRMRQNKRRARTAIQGWHARMMGGALGVKTVAKTRGRLCLRFDSEEAATVAADMIREEGRAHKILMVFNYPTEVDVRSVPFTKGMAVAELGRRIGVAPGQILAIGNGHNDLSMLDGTVAKFTGCPSNSKAEVIEAVHQVGGHIASKRSLTGVVEVLDAYADGGELKSELPEWYSYRSGDYNPRSQRAPHPTPGRSPQQRRNRLLIAGIVYAVIVVFSAFGLIPFVSDWVMEPYYALVALFGRLMSRLYGG